MKSAFKKTLNSFSQSLPIIISILLLIGLAIATIPKEFYAVIFSGNKFLDPLIGALFGSISEGNPVTSYILGGELLKQGVSLLAVTAFLLAWVTVGIIQLPAESLMLGKKFAIARNSVSFLTAIIAAIFTIITLSII